MRDRRYKNLTVRAFAAGTGLSVIVGTFAAPLTTMAAAKDMEKPVVLRVCNWEEYIDEGGWESRATKEKKPGRPHARARETAHGCPKPIPPL